jgi:histidine triad (HIT) family protein
VLALFYSVVETDSAPYDGTDFYCDVALADPSRLRVVHDDDSVLAFHHTRPHWVVHIVVVPKRHIGSLTTVTAADEADVRALFSAVQAVARDVESTYGGAAVLTNLGGYQDSKHLHGHIHSGGPCRTAQG